ncbi:hypothetical protein [Desulfatiglans anilini]|uniref:hypothetical protein n=1 Tax=Desulfatiglans anilini TaxID=90728 RepID=UPI0012947763|nr:hypothetical protein [Desulfatiglans anilini]
MTSGPDKIQIERNFQISIPLSSSERGIAVRLSDWKRIKRDLIKASTPTKSYSPLYSALLGFSGSALLSVFPHAIIQDLPAWMLPTSIALVFAPLLCAFLVIYLDRDLRSRHKSMIEELLADIDEIGSRFNLDPEDTE